MEALTWEDLLGRPLGDAVRLVVDHERVRRFRWLFLIELALGLVLLACLIPLWLIASLLADEPVAGGLGFLEGRSHRWEHHMRLQLFGRDGTVLHEQVVIVRDDAERDRLLATVLQAADRARLIVVETLDRTWLATYYGGRPLMVPPDLASLRQVEAALKLHPEVEIERGSDSLVARVRFPAESRFASLVRLLFGPPFLVWSRAGREAMMEYWLTLRGVAPAVLHLEVRAAGIRWGRVRAGKGGWEEVMGGDLLAVAWSRDVNAKAIVQPPSLRLIGRRGIATVRVPANDALGAQLANLVRVATLELRANNPALRLGFALNGEIRCGYCGTLYDFEKSGRCPTCGAPPMFNS